MRQLNPDCVVDSHENKQQSVADEVCLAVVSQLIVVLARLLIHLNRGHVDWFIADEGDSEPNRGKGPEADDLDKQDERIDSFDLCRQRVPP